MKKLLTSLAPLVLLLVICMTSFSQNNERLPKFGEYGSSNADELTSNSSKSKKNKSQSAETFSARALVHLNNLFHPVTVVSWFTSKNEISASFMQDDVRTRVIFTKKGRWSYSFIYYRGYKLAPSLRSLVLNDYANYEILGVTEIHVHSDVIYLVNIENQKNVKKLVIYNGSVSISQEFERAN